MRFRPYPILTAACLVLWATLIWLGNWQLDRAHWKAGLIREAEAAAREAPVPMRDALCSRDKPIGAIVDARDAQRQVAPTKALRVFGRSVAGEAGWRIFSPAAIPCRAGEAHVLVETGFDPIPGEAPLSPKLDLAKLSVSPWPPTSMFAPPNDAAGNDWHSFDREAMEAALGEGTLSGDYILEAFDGVPPFLTAVPPARHYGYAVTWFGMALGLLGVYLALHHRAGRLRFMRPKEAPSS